jgi:hypothetical protein
LVLQASFDGTSVQLTSLSGAEFDCVQAAPTDRIADVRARLMAGRVTAVLGSMFSTASVVLPRGELLSKAPASETCATAFGCPTAC